jgi:mono/diheme cytochrome c family protein
VDPVGEKVMKLSLMKGVLTGLLLFTQIPEASAEVTKALLDRGALLYKSNCIQCHNKDPNLKGSIGPEMVDAPLEVMTSKVMTGAYPAVLPAGFVPKRKSKAMRKLPQLQKDIPAIYAWVQSVKKKK